MPGQVLEHDVGNRHGAHARPGLARTEGVSGPGDLEQLAVDRQLAAQEDGPVDGEAESFPPTHLGRPQGADRAVTERRHDVPTQPGLGRLGRGRPVHLRRLPLGGVLGQRVLPGSRVDHIAPVQLRLGSVGRG